MRTFFSYVTAVMIPVLVLHGICASYLLVGIGHTGVPFLAWMSLILILIHAVLGCILTGRTLAGMYHNKSPWYIWQNRLFWARRLSGIAILGLLWIHLGLFGSRQDGVFVVYPFTISRLIVHGVFVAVVFLHVFLNIRPLFVALGVSQVRNRTADCCFVLSILFLAMAVMAVLYYMRGGI